MNALHLILGVFLALYFCSSFVWSQFDYEVDIEGPIMLTNKDGSLMTTKQLIDGRKYKGETHTVTTSDGYILTVFRVVPDKLPASVVLLQHGLFASSDCWVADNGSLAFKLSDAGYDVWLSNARGNCYSRKHTKLDPNKDKSYWNFSWHEMGTEDLPAVVDYILKATSQAKLHYIGHSMGTIMGFILTSVKPEYNKKLKSFVAFSPVAFLSKATDMVGPDGMVEEMATKYIDKFISSDKWEVFPRHDFFTNNKTQITCFDVEENFQYMCIDKMEMSTKILGGAYFPAGQSLKTLLHFHQLGRTGKMVYYNYSTPEENEKIYKSKEPPSYLEQFKNIICPVILWSSANDGLVVDKDVDDLKPMIKSVIADNRIQDECFDHMTFCFPRKVACMPVREKFYKNLTEALRKLD